MDTQQSDSGETQQGAGVYTPQSFSGEMGIETHQSSDELNSQQSPENVQEMFPVPYDTKSLNELFQKCTK